MKLQNLFLIVIGIVCVGPLASHGNVQEAWVARYDGPGNYNDEATAAAVDGSGNVYVTGFSFDPNTDYDYTTIKYNSAGQQEWVARYDGTGSYIDKATAIAVDGSGNVYVTGASTSGNGSLDYATIKYNSAGQQQWVAYYDGPGGYIDQATAIAVDGSGHVYMTGSSYGSNTAQDYATIKYNSAGQQQWVARYDGPANSYDGATAMVIDGSGSVYVTGTSYGGGYSSDDYATIRYNSAGQQQWVARYNGPANSNDEATAMVIDGSGNICVTGYSTGSVGYDYATIKYNSAGQQQWFQRYDGPAHSDDVANAISIDGSGFIYVTGFSTGTIGYYDYATIKYDASGQQQWVRRYNGPANYDDQATAIAVDGSGSVYVTGESYGSGYSGYNWDYATIKYDSAGQQQWVARYGGPGGYTDQATAIALDGSDNVLVTGYSLGSDHYSDYATIKYVQGATPTPTPTPIPTPTPTPTPPIASPYDFNNDGKPDFVLYNGSTRQTAVWYMNNNVYTGGSLGPTLPIGWSVIDVADFNRDGNNDYALFNSITRQTAIWYLSGVTLVGGVWGPTIPNGWALVATGDFNWDGNPDYVLFNASTRQTIQWYMNNNVYISGAFGPTLPGGWRLAGVAVSFWYGSNYQTDYALFNPSTRQSGIYHLYGQVYVSGAFGPPIASGYELMGMADFNGDGWPDDVLYNASTRRTAFYYLNNNVYAGSALGPVLPAGWNLVAP